MPVVVGAGGGTALASKLYEKNTCSLAVNAVVLIKIIVSILEILFRIIWCLPIRFALKMLLVDKF
jgi:hypothetical protein